MIPVFQQSRGRLLRQCQSWKSTRVPQLMSADVVTAAVPADKCLVSKGEFCHVQKAARRAALTISVFTHTFRAPCRMAACCQFSFAGIRKQPPPQSLANLRFPAVSITSDSSGG